MLPDWTRLIWVSQAARELWQERLNNINGAWLRIERWAVVEGARQSALTFFEPSYLPEATRWATGHGLVLLPLAQVGVADQYSATPQAVEVGGKWQYRAVLTHAKLGKEWIEAWMDTGQGGRYNGTNNRSLGELLGYPQCCIDFFEREWVQHGSVDTTWAMAENSGAAQITEHAHTHTIADMPVEANILLRWLGVRLVAHLPCSFYCTPTVQMARAFADVGRARHFQQWIDMIYEMLAWPIEWSAANGIAEIRTPVVTISSRTDPAPHRRVVQYRGWRLPEHAAQGLHFPYRVAARRQVTEKPVFKRSLTPIWELNGFSSLQGMDEAHETLLRALSALLPERGDSFLDLGCGTGRLMERIASDGWNVAGIELDDARAGAARTAVRRGNILDLPLWDQHFTVVGVMPGRLLEGATPEQCEAFRAALRRRADYVLLYAYGDWLTRFGGLRPLLDAAGLGDVVEVQAAQRPGVEAILGTFPDRRGHADEETTTHAHAGDAKGG